MNDKKVRTPRNLDSIKAGALKLPLADRVALVQALNVSIAEEVKQLRETADNATKIANGTSGS